MIEIFLDAPTELQAIILFGIVAIIWHIIKEGKDKPYE
jgi:hypothetical protein|tara:strand:+ start:328 stop:441 length:114 start_codon:yes stop_codon:yes gene_type:complete